MRGEERSFRELELAQQNRTGTCQAFHDSRVEVGHMAGVDRHAGRGHDASRVADVFDRNRNAVQRPTIGACSDFSFRTAGLRGRQLGFTVA